MIIKAEDYQTTIIVNENYHFWQFLKEKNDFIFELNLLSLNSLIRYLV